MKTSLLERVADHERGLLSEVNASEQEAHEILQAAHAEAAVLLAQAHHDLEADVRRLSRISAGVPPAEAAFAASDHHVVACRMPLSS